MKAPPSARLPWWRVARLRPVTPEKQPREAPAAQRRPI
jgi:hypothetical protein